MSVSFSFVSSVYLGYQQPVNTASDVATKAVSDEEKDGVKKFLDDKSKTWFNSMSENGVSKLTLPPAIKSLEIENGGLVQSWERGTELGAKNKAFHIDKEGNLTLKGDSGEHVIKKVGFGDSTEKKFPKGGEPSFRRTVFDDKDLVVKVSRPIVEGARPELSTGSLSSFRGKSLSIGIPNHPAIRFEAIEVNGEKSASTPDPNKSAFRDSFRIDGTGVEYRGGSISVDPSCDVPQKIKFSYLIPGTGFKGSQTVTFKN